MIAIDPRQAPKKKKLKARREKDERRSINAADGAPRRFPRPFSVLSLIIAAMLSSNRFLAISSECDSTAKESGRSIEVSGISGDPIFCNASATMMLAIEIKVGRSLSPDTLYYATGSRINTSTSTSPLGRIVAGLVTKWHRVPKEYETTGADRARCTQNILSAGKGGRERGRVRDETRAQAAR